MRQDARHKFLETNIAMVWKLDRELKLVRKEVLKIEVALNRTVRRGQNICKVATSKASIVMTRCSK